MLRSLAFPVLLVSLGCSQPCPEPRVLPALSEQPLGGPCSFTGSECRAGLSCASIFPPPEEAFGASVSTERACTLDCSVVTCPQGSACIDAPQASGASTKVCVPSCETDADCTGLRQASCRFGEDGGVSLCVPTTCSSDNACPSTLLADGGPEFFCQVDRQVGQCQSYVSAAEVAPPRPALGWCRRL